MKKTLIALAVVFLVVIALQAVLFYGRVPFDIPGMERSVAAVSYSSGNEIYIGQGSEPFQVRGVLMDSCLPGYYSNDFAVEEEEYFSWMEQIAEMGANTISVYSMMDPDFYSALYRYNTDSETPLYLIQGVTVPDYNLNNSKDAWEGFYDKLLSDARDTVDAVNGNLIMSLGRVQSGGNYIFDVSEWTIAYLLGTEWVSYTLAYTDNKEGNPDSYAGEYFMTAEGATPSEAMFARLMDEIAVYEAGRYGKQRIIGFSNSTSTDPLTYNENVRMQLDKCVSLNADNVLPTEKSLSGCFAGYYLRGEVEEFMAWLDDRDWQAYGDVLAQTDGTGVYGGYVDFLVRLHDMPVVVYYGFSSSRGTDDPDGPMTEEEQGISLVEYYEAFMEEECQGAVIATWQDNWSRTTWNTMFAVDEEQEKNWYDVQSLNNGFGLLCFEPGEDEAICYVDGDMKEWEEADQVFSNGSLSLSVEYDEAYLYLMVCGEEYDEPLYLPVDVTPNSGSNYAAEQDARFEGFADFLLEIDGRDSARLLVQQRYDAAYMAWEERISGVNAFYNQPDVNSSAFSPIRLVLKKTVDPDAEITDIDMSVEERTIFNRYDVLETGELRHGNANPGSPDYDSLADYCYGDGCLEVRIPWQLLNFSNPSEQKVHDDYYLHYGVENIRVNGISLGVGFQDSFAVIPMEWVQLEAWNESVEYHERLKQSYYIVQSAWKETADDH